MPLLDAIELKILGVLQEGGRITTIQLAGRVGPFADAPNAAAA